MNKNKREILKGLAIGSVWATPVVSSVVLPVHASTTGCDGLIEVSFSFTGGGTVNWETYVGIDGAEPEAFDFGGSDVGPLEVKRTLPEGTTEVWLYGVDVNNCGRITQTISCCNALISKSGVENLTVCAAANFSDDGSCSLIDTSETCWN